MANDEHAALLKQGVEAWNAWRDKNPDRPNLSGADLRRADLRKADFSEANLSAADLSGADLSKADLSGASLVRTRLSATTMTGAKVYGASVWDVETDEETKQTGLIVTPDDQSAIMVDDLEVAQFIYLLLDREKIRNVINTVTRRGVLLLGRFGDGGLALLQAVAAWLRRPENGGYLPLLFDFPRPESKSRNEFNAYNKKRSGTTGEESNMLLIAPSIQGRGPVHRCQSIRQAAGVAAQTVGEIGRGRNGRRRTFCG
jgi:hypothetical protein